VILPVSRDSGCFNGHSCLFEDDPLFIAVAVIWGLDMPSFFPRSWHRSSTGRFLRGPAMGLYGPDRLWSGLGPVIMGFVLLPYELYNHVPVSGPLPLINFVYFCFFVRRGEGQSYSPKGSVT